MNKMLKLIRICLLGAVLLQAATSRAQPVTQVAGGNLHTLFLKGDGSLWGMGYNADGELGTNGLITRPAKIVASNVVAVAAGTWHSLFLKSDGSLWAMGDNTYGELGDGTFRTYYPYAIYHPEQIVASNVTAIAAGTDFSLFLKSDGSLWGMGINNEGNLGYVNYSTNYSANSVIVPEQIVDSGVTAIAAGQDFSLFIKNDGSLWALGAHSLGQLGDGFLNPGTHLSAWWPEQIVSSGVTAVAAGWEHSLFLKSDGSAWGMGRDLYGQLGIVPGEYAPRPIQLLASNVTAIAAEQYSSLFLMRDGSLWGMGDNTTGPGQTSVIAGELGSYTVRYFHAPTKIADGNITAISGGYSTTFFLKSDGSLWGLGDNQDYELGVGAGNAYAPEQIVAGPPGYNQITARLISGGDVALSFVGIVGASYALERSSDLGSPNWVPQLTNSAGTDGALVFTSTPDPTTNNFWRIRAVK
ncbi:MAG: hypothetical protein JWR26_1321 [Pedosphaera sp.]|nr:hypothetical protein [Pedosphaera sp.]